MGRFFDKTWHTYLTINGRQEFDQVVQKWQPQFLPFIMHGI